MRTKETKVILTKISKFFFIIIVLLLCIPYIIYSQNDSQIKFDKLQPLWQHIIVDSSLIPEFAYGKDMFLNNTKYIVNNQDIYIADTYFGQFLGAYFESINITDGKKNWSNYFDKRNIDKMESVSHFNLINNGLEVLCFRAKNNSIIFNKKHKFSRWIIDNNSGIKLKHDFASFKDTLSPTLYSFLGFSSSSLYPVEDRFIYASRANVIKDSADVYAYILDSLGSVITKNFIYNLEKKYYYNELHSFHKINQDSFLAIRFNYNTLNSDSDTLKTALYFDIFNNKLQLLFTKEIKGLEYENNKYTSISIKYIDNQFFIIETNDAINEVIYLYTFSGILINKFNVKTSENNVIYYTTVNKINDGTFLLTGTTYNSKPGKYNYLHFFNFSQDSKMELLKRYRILPESHILETNYIEQLANNDIILGGIHSYIEFEFGEYKRKSGNWHTLMRIKSEDLGLYNSIIDSDSKSLDKLKLTPNPVNNLLKVNSEKIKINKIEIFNNIGELVIKEMHENVNTLTIDISSLNKGIYFIKAYNKKNMLESGKIIKVIYK